MKLQHITFEDYLTCEGIIKELKEDTFCNNEILTFCTVTYDINNKTYSNLFKYTSNHNVGDKVIIRYDEQSPEHSILYEEILNDNRLKIKNSLYFFVCNTIIIFIVYFIHSLSI